MYSRFVSETKPSHYFSPGNAIDFDFCEATMKTWLQLVRAGASAER